MATLYVTEQGARVEKEYRRIVVSKGDERLVRVPIAHVSEVVLVGRVGVTTPALLSLLHEQVGLSLVSRAGTLRGRLQPAEGRYVQLRKAQYAKTDEAAFCMALSRGLITGKICNSRVMAMRILRKARQVSPGEAEKLAVEVARITAALGKVAQTEDLDRLRGLEGSCARAYFSVLRQALRWEGAQGFAKRTRRPPRDPVNALLSFGYTLLKNALMSALEVVGLDPYAGYFHAEKYGRPALALDLMEEFRPLIVDSLVLTLVNKKMLKEKDFEITEQGVYLTRRGLKVFFRAYAKRMQTRVYHPLAGRSLSYRKILEVQARQVRKLVEGQAETYTPFTTR